MTVIGICRRPRASAGWVRGPSTKPSSTRSAYLVPSAEFATPGLGVLVIDDPEQSSEHALAWSALHRFFPPLCRMPNVKKVRFEIGT